MKGSNVSGEEGGGIGTRGGGGMMGMDGTERAVDVTSSTIIFELNWLMMDRCKRALHFVITSPWDSRYVVPVAEIFFLHP